MNLEKHSCLLSFSLIKRSRLRFNVKTREANQERLCSKVNTRNFHGYTVNSSLPFN
jgi:hypothetical protein